MFISLGISTEEASYLISCFKFGIKLTEDLFQLFSDDISQYIQPTSKKIPNNIMSQKCKLHRVRSIKLLKLQDTPIRNLEFSSSL